MNINIGLCGLWRGLCSAKKVVSRGNTLIGDNVSGPWVP